MWTREIRIGVIVALAASLTLWAVAVVVSGYFFSIICLLTLAQK